MPTIAGYLLALAAILGGVHYLVWTGEQKAKHAQEAANAATLIRRTDNAAGASRAFEVERDAIRARVTPQPRVDAALASPVCPASAPSVALGDVVLSPELLLGMRIAAGQSGPADPGKPGQAMPDRPTDPRD